jgi:hypothetical protein
VGSKAAFTDRPSSRAARQEQLVALAIIGNYDGSCAGILHAAYLFVQWYLAPIHKSYATKELLRVDELVPVRQVGHAVHNRRRYQPRMVWSVHEML